MVMFKVKKCQVCKDSSFTSDNYTERRRVTTSTGVQVHVGCLGRWLIDDAIARHFPGSDPREREVVRLRLGLPAEPALASLQSVGRTMEWTGSMRASQVQVAAFERFERSASAKLKARASAANRRVEKQDALERLEKAADEMRQATEAVWATSSAAGGHPTT